MKVLIVPASYPRFAGDYSGIFVRDQATILATRHQVSVLVPHLLTVRALWTGLRRRKVSITAMDGVRQIPVFIPNLTNRWEWLTHQRWQQVMISQAHRMLAGDSAPDVIHAHFVRPSGRVGLALARRLSAKAVLTEHSGPFSDQVQPGWRRKQTDRVLHQMDGVAVVSPQLGTEVQREFSDLKPRVLGNVVDEDFFNRSSRRSEIGTRRPFRFLFVGNLVEQKGLSFLLDAVAQLTEQTCDWRLEIAGMGPLREALVKQCQQLNIASRVIFSGRLDRTAVRTAMHLADAFVLSSVTETFGVVLIEAMACGLPVVATDCGGPRWIVTPRTGRLVPTQDSGSLACALGEMIRDREQFNDASIRAEVIARFGRERWLKDCEAFYRAATSSCN